MTSQIIILTLNATQKLFNFSSILIPSSQILERFLLILNRWGIPTGANL